MKTIRLQRQPYLDPLEGLYRQVQFIGTTILRMCVLVYMIMWNLFMYVCVYVHVWAYTYICTYKLHVFKYKHTHM